MANMFSNLWPLATAMCSLGGPGAVPQDGAGVLPLGRTGILPLGGAGCHCVAL